MEQSLEFEKGQDISVEITNVVDGFLISFPSIIFDDIPFEEITNYNSVLERIRGVSAALKVSPSKFLIEFQYDVGCAHCAVDKNHILLLSLPIKVVEKKIIIVDNQGISDDYLLYHELMHAKEVLDGRFHSSGLLGPDNYVETLIGRLNDFANEGKLEAMGKPHETRERSIENIYQSFLEDCKFGALPIEKMQWLSRESVTSLCNKVWGKELTYPGARQIIRQLINE